MFSDCRRNGGNYSLLVLVAPGQFFGKALETTQTKHAQHRVQTNNSALPNMCNQLAPIAALLGRVLNISLVMGIKDLLNYWF